MKYKDYYNDQYIQEFSEKLALVMPGFDSKVFSQNLIGQLVDMLNAMEIKIIACHYHF